jgi:hypothetical protein
MAGGEVRVRRAVDDDAAGAADAHADDNSKQKRKGDGWGMLSPAAHAARTLIHQRPQRVAGLRQVATRHVSKSETRIHATVASLFCAIVLKV